MQTLALLTALALAHGHNPHLDPQHYTAQQMYGKGFVWGCGPVVACHEDCIEQTLTEQSSTASPWKFQLDTETKCTARCGRSQSQTIDQLFAECMRECSTIQQDYYMATVESTRPQSARNWFEPPDDPCDHDCFAIRRERRREMVDRCKEEKKAYEQEIQKKLEDAERFEYPASSKTVHARDTSLQANLKHPIVYKTKKLTLSNPKATQYPKQGTSRKNRDAKRK